MIGPCCCLHDCTIVIVNNLESEWTRSYLGFSLKVYLWGPSIVLLRFFICVGGNVIKHSIPVRHKILVLRDSWLQNSYLTSDCHAVAGWKSLWQRFQQLPLLWCRSYFLQRKHFGMFLRSNTYRCRAGKRSWVMMMISHLNQSHQTLSNHTWTHPFFEGPVNKEGQRSHDHSKVELPSSSLYLFDCPLSLSLSVSVYIYIFPCLMHLTPSRFLCLPQASQKLLVVHE